MSILIKGMEMPTEEEISKCIIVRHDGEVWIVEFDTLVDGGYVACYPTNPMRAVPVLPHGRLIDADALMDYEVLLPMDGGSMPIIYSSYIRNAPTIIEAEEGE